MFDRIGEIAYPPTAGDPDRVLEAAIDAGADDVQSDADGHIVTTAVEDFAAVRDALEDALGASDTAGLVWRAQTTVSVEEDPATTLFKLLDALEDNDDVQRVHANFEVPDDVMARLAG